MEYRWPRTLSADVILQRFRVCLPVGQGKPGSLMVSGCSIAQSHPLPLSPQPCHSVCKRSEPVNIHHRLILHVVTRQCQSVLNRCHVCLIILTLLFYSIKRICHYLNRAPTHITLKLSLQFSSHSLFISTLSGQLSPSFGFSFILALPFS